MDTHLFNSAPSVLFSVVFHDKKGWGLLMLNIFFPPFNITKINNCHHLLLLLWKQDISKSNEIKSHVIWMLSSSTFSSVGNACTTYVFFIIASIVCFWLVFVNAAFQTDLFQSSQSWFVHVCTSARLIDSSVILRSGWTGSCRLSGASGRYCAPGRFCEF